MGAITGQRLDRLHLVLREFEGTCRQVVPVSCVRHRTCPERHIPTACAEAEDHSRRRGSIARGDRCDARVKVTLRGSRSGARNPGTRFRARDRTIARRGPNQPGVAPVLARTTVPEPEGRHLLEVPQGNIAHAERSCSFFASRSRRMAFQDSVSAPVQPRPDAGPCKTKQSTWSVPRCSSEPAIDCARSAAGS